MQLASQKYGKILVLKVCIKTNLTELGPKKGELILNWNAPFLVN